MMIVMTELQFWNKLSIMRFRSTIVLFLMVAAEKVTKVAGKGLQERATALRRTGLGSSVTRGRKTFYGFGPHPRPKAIPFGLAPICFGSETGTEYKKQPRPKALIVLVQVQVLELRLNIFLVHLHKIRPYSSNFNTI